MKKKDKKWVTPELIILTKDEPGENVLAMCACSPKGINDDDREWHDCYIGCFSCFGGCDPS